MDPQTYGTLPLLKPLAFLSIYFLDHIPFKTSHILLDQGPYLILGA